MIGTLDLYYIPAHQFANRQFFIGTKTSYKLGSVSGVKYNGNLVQTLKLPDNALFAKFNVVGLGGKYYDVVSVDSSTQEQKSASIKIVFNPVITYISTAATISGYWERTPSMLVNGVKLGVTDDMLKTSRTVKLPNLGTAAGVETFYYQITAKYDLATSDSTKLCLYGGIVPWLSYYIPSGTASTWQIRSTQDTLYCALSHILNDIDTMTGLPSDSIVDVSVSARCPWKTSFSNPIYSIMAGSTPCAPVSDSPSYSVIPIIGSGAHDTTDKANALTLTLSDYERYCGRVMLTDEMGNDIAEIPTELFNSSNQLTYYCYGSSDFGGLFTHFKYLDNIIVMPEGRLPWVGDNWIDYQIRTMTYDREELARNISTVKQQYEIDAINAVGNAMMTSAVGAMSNPAGSLLGLAQMGLGLVTADMAKDMNIRDLYAAQSNKEALIKASPSNNYQVGYGLDYCHRSAQVGGAKLKIQTPANITSTDFDNFVAYRGWPCNKYATITPSTGYLKGILYSVPVSGTDPAGNGTEIDALRREIANGVRIVTA